VISSSKSKLIVFALVTRLVSIASASAADLDVRPYHKRYRQVASLEQVAYTPECRVGWWQTMRANHVRSRWEMRCR
jgi:hypothetical protein